MENKFKTILYDERWDPSDVALVGHHKKWVIFDIKEGDDERKVDILINFDKGYICHKYLKCQLFSS